MARYFQAPVMGPVDYGYVEPFKERYAVMQEQQQLFDKGEAAARALYDVGKFDILDPDIAGRDKILQNRYDQVDKIMYDDEGKMRDMRNVHGMVQSEARRRAKEEQVGGALHAMTSNYAAAQAYKESVKKAHGKGTWGAERADWLIGTSMANYKGIGDKDQLGAYRSFQGISGAKELDHVKTAHDIAKNVQTSTFQSAGLLDEKGVLADKEALENWMNTPEFKKVYGGQFIQTGTVEIRTLEFIKARTLEGLSANQQLKEDLIQEANQKGITDPTKAYEYYADKLDFLATQSGLTFAEQHFKPQVRDNWVFKQANKHKYDKALEDYKKTDQYNIIESDIATSTHVLTDVNKNRENLTRVRNLISELKKKIAPFEIGNTGIVSPNLGKMELQEYQALRNELNSLQVEESQYAANNDAVFTSLENKHGAEFIMNKVTNRIYDAFSNMSKNPNKDVFIKELSQLFKNNGYEGAELAKAWESGELFTKRADGSYVFDIRDEVSALARKHGIKPPSQQFGRGTKRSKANYALANYFHSGSEIPVEGEHTALFDDQIYEMQENKEITMEADVNAITSVEESGFMNRLNKQLTEHLNLESMDFKLAGGHFKPSQYAADLGIEGAKFKATGGSTLAPDGSWLVPVTITGKKNGKTVKQTAVTKVPGTSTLGRKLALAYRTQGTKLMDAATAAESGEVSYDDIEQGAHVYGVSLFSGTNWEQQANKLSPGMSVRIENPKAPDKPIFIKQLATSGKYVAAIGKIDVYTGKVTEPNWDDTDSYLRSTIPGKRVEGREDNYLYGSPDAIRTQLGYLEYHDDANPIFNSRNYK